MEYENTIAIGLYDPGMNHLHRVGLAGLYMTLRKLGAGEGLFACLDYAVDKHKVKISWTGNRREVFDDLFKTAFGSTKHEPKGLIQFLAHRDLGIGDIQKVELTKALQDSFLQHPQHKKIPKGTPNKTIAVSLNDEQVVIEYRPFERPYAHAAQASKLLFDEKGRLKSHVTIKGWLYPGAAERHSHLTGTEMEERPETFLCLLFAPTACLYYRLFHRGQDGRIDARRGVAVCVPHINDLKSYADAYQRYLLSPVERLSADGPGDAGLSALLALRVEEKLTALGITGCTVFTMGSIPWSKQQRTRTAVSTLDDIDEATLDRFDLACRWLPNQVVVKRREDKKKKNKNTEENTFFVATSLSRGLIAENIAHGREWYEGFCQLMRSKQLSTAIGYERKGLKTMVDEVQWSHESDRKLVEAVHIAIRNRYGALAARAREKGEAIRFDREFGRMRTGLMRAKNAQTLRAELADLFVRGGINSVLQQDWQRVLTLFAGKDWQRARDLALLALASYTGKGAEEIESAEQTYDGEE